MKAYHKLRNPKERRFTGEYAEDGKARRLAVRAAAGHRCVRCQHPFESGKHGKGEWSPCDERCTHRGPIAIFLPGCGDYLLINSPATAAGQQVFAQWRILTVHHLTGEKDNDSWWNCLALCQRCHLEIQGKVDPRVPWFLEHSEWFKPYAAGFYAKKYEGRDITREEAMERLDELLRYELKTDRE